MNLAQIRVAARDLLTAGSGQNDAFPADDFWSDNELNNLANQAQSKIFNIIRQARADYFTRMLKSTDSALLILGQTFTPSTLTWVANQGEYILPPDFLRMKMISDLATSGIVTGKQG